MIGEHREPRIQNKCREGWSNSLMNGPGHFLLLFRTMTNAKAPIAISSGMTITRVTKKQGRKLFIEKKGSASCLAVRLTPFLSRSDTTHISGGATVATLFPPVVVASRVRPCMVTRVMCPCLTSSKNSEYSI